MTNKKNCAQGVIEQLLLDGLNDMFGNPGSTEEGFIDALRGYPDFNYYLAFHEGAAVAMASAYSKSTKKTSVVQLHNGAGLGNAIGLLWQAYTEQIPMLVLSGEAGIKYDAMESYLSAKLIDMAKPVTKAAMRVVDSKSVLRILRRAIKMASTPPMGPVFVSLPMDMLDSDLSEQIVPSTVINNKNCPCSEVLEEIADTLLKAENPAFLIGDRIYFCDANEALTDLAETIGAKVWGVNSSLVNMDNSHPLFMGITGHSFGSTGKKLLKDVDAVLILGTYIFPEIFPELDSVFSKGTKVMHIDNVDYDIAKNHPVDIAVNADLEFSLTRLSAILKEKITQNKQDKITEKIFILKNQKEKQHKTEVENDKSQFRPDAVHAAEFALELAKRKNENVIYYDESITHIPIVLRYMGAEEINTAFFMRDGCLGTALPGAVGLAVANPDKIVLGFSGDGGSLFTLQSLATAARYNLNTKFIIWNNASYQVLKINLLQYWQQRGINPHEMPNSFDLQTPHLNFVKMAEGFGIEAIRIEKPQEINSALDKMFSSKGPFLLDVVVFDRAQSPVV